MKLTVTNEGSTQTIAIEGWLDTRTSPELAEQLAQIPEGTEELIFDLTDMEYTSSAGLRQFVTAAKQMNGHIKLKGVRAEIMDVLKMTGLDKKLVIE